MDKPFEAIEVTGWMDAIDKGCQEVIIRVVQPFTIVQLSDKYHRNPLIDVAVIAKWDNGMWAGVGTNDITYVFNVSQIVKGVMK